MAEPDHEIRTTGRDVVAAWILATLFLVTLMLVF